MAKIGVEYEVPCNPNGLLSGTNIGCEGPGTSKSVYVDMILGMWGRNEAQM